MLGCCGVPASLGSSGGGGSSTPTISVSSPSAGQSFSQGSEVSVTFTVSDITAVCVRLMDAGTAAIHSIISTSYPVSSGSNTYSWTVPSSLVVGNYWIDIVDGTAGRTFAQQANVYYEGSGYVEGAAPPSGSFAVTTSTINKCAGVSCGSYGTCATSSGQCVCSSGYTGSSCQTAPTSTSTSSGSGVIDFYSDSSCGTSVGALAFTSGQCATTTYQGQPVSAMVRAPPLTGCRESRLGARWKCVDGVLV